MVKLFIQGHTTGKVQRHTPSLLTPGLYFYSLHKSVCIFSFKTCDCIWIFKFSFCSGPYIFKSNPTHLRHCCSGPVFICKSYVYRVYLCAFHVVSHHQKTRACVRVSANKICKCILISIFTGILAMDDQRDEERNKYLDRKMWWWTMVSSFLMAWEYEFKRQWKTFRNKRWKKKILP